MRSKIKVFIILLVLIFATGKFPQEASAQQPYISFQVFYDELSPFGEWVNYPNLGYVWIPDAGPDFIPYSSQGHWIFTDYGWTWMSDYIWGWAPFHYGRWGLDNYYGWFWIPDNEWGPAWVSWRRSEGYYGWAPMGPGISLSASFGMGYNNRNDHWIFVRDRDIDRTDINHYFISRTDQDRIVRRSSIINNTYVDSRTHTTYVTGPARADFQKVSGRQVNQVAIQEYDKPGQDYSNGRFRIYRPEVVKTSEKDAQPRNANPHQNIRTEKQPVNVKSQVSDPPQNLKRVQKQNNDNQQNNARQQSNYKQQKINQSQNTGKDKQSENARSTKSIKGDQQKKSNNARDKKDND